MPTWNLRTLWRHTLRTAGKLPAELSARHGAGKFRFAMMDDQSLRKGWGLVLLDTGLKSAAFQAAISNAWRLIFLDSLDPTFRSDQRN